MLFGDRRAGHPPVRADDRQSGDPGRVRRRAGEEAAAVLLRVPSVACARATTCTTDLAATTISFCASIPWRVSASASSESAAIRSSRSVSIERARSIISGTTAISASSSRRARMLSVACGLLARGAGGRKADRHGPFLRMSSQNRFPLLRDMLRRSSRRSIKACFARRAALATASNIGCVPTADYVILRSRIARCTDAAEMTDVPIARAGARRDRGRLPGGRAGGAFGHADRGFEDVRRRIDRAGDRGGAARVRREPRP